MSQLRRGPATRLASSGVQLLLTVVVFALVAAAVVGAVKRRLGNVPGWTFWVVAVPAVLLWLAGITAWAKADDAGLSWRYIVKQQVLWDRVTSIDLTKHAVVPASYPGSYRYTIVVRGRDVRGEHLEENIRPLEGCRKAHRQRFADELAALAQQHGKQVRVRSRGWRQPLPSDAEDEKWT